MNYLNLKQVYSILLERYLLHGMSVRNGLSNAVDILQPDPQVDQVRDQLSRQEINPNNVKLYAGQEQVTGSIEELIYRGETTGNLERIPLKDLTVVLSEMPDRFEIPKVEGHIEGNKTIITNWYYYIFN